MDDSSYEFHMIFTCQNCFHMYFTLSKRAFDERNCPKCNVMNKVLNVVRETVENSNLHWIVLTFHSFSQIIGAIRA